MKIMLKNIMTRVMNTITNINILILGNGAREKIIQDKLISLNSHNVIHILDIDNFESIKEFCINNNIILVIPSTEEYLCKGIVDYLNAELPDIKVFGPNKKQARLESSKYYSKNLMIELKIPTPKHLFFQSYGSPQQAWDNHWKEMTKNNFFPVIKYSGLAKGKGVYLPQNITELEDDVRSAFNHGEDGILVEERLYGTEVSVIAFCNGREAILMPQSQDYKRVYDGDKGPNTGGMGAICPVNILTTNELNEVKIHMDSIVKKLNYIGILYAGLMKTTTGIYFLEFNCRFGDPEAQAILSLLDDSCKLSDILIACINGDEQVNDMINWKKDSVAAVVVLSHIDYPITKLDEATKISYNQVLDTNIKIYESNVRTVLSTGYNNIKTTTKSTTGGRVLSMTSVGKTQQEALENIYNNIHKISYDGIYFRRDIGSNTISNQYANNNTNNNTNINDNKCINIGILASGNGTSITKLLNERKEFVKIIITNKKDAGIIKKAQQYNIPYFYIPQDTYLQPSLYNKSYIEYYEKIVNILRLYHIELVILAGYMKIVPDILFDEFFTINIHPSLLPKYGGLSDLNVHTKVLSNSEIFSGCTLHKVTKHVDGGQILMQKQYKLNKDETVDTLKTNVQILEQQCILEYINIYNNSYQTKVKYDVNINEGNEFIKELKKTNPTIGGFCAEYLYKNIRLAASADGCGTKLDLANKYNKLDTIGIDLVAMNINDLIAGGATPLFFLDYIALDKMDKIKCETIISGINEGCRIAGCKLIGGETAEMKNIYLKNKLDLAGFAVGETLYDFPKREMMTDGCLLYGITSSGIHSNGYTLVKKLLSETKTWPFTIDEILKPTRIYTDILKLCDIFSDRILGISHITGGGFCDNLHRILPDNLDFELDEWEFPPIFKWIQEASKLSRDEMLSTFNCGYGMVIITNIEFDLLELEAIFDTDKFNMQIIGKLVSKGS